jgi:MoaA/NifB/PqqE/SkfB family radical SAM enzyme
MDLLKKKKEIFEIVKQKISEKTQLNEINDDILEKHLYIVRNNNNNKYNDIEKNLSDSNVQNFTNEIVENFLNSWDYKKQNFNYKNSKKCCLAPYTTLNFDTTGIMRVCCYNNKFVLGTYPETSLKDAWNNPSRQEFINSLTNKSFPGGCDHCFKQALQGNIANALFTQFDHFDGHLASGDYPISLNFDFGSICNLECIMCGGKWSSSIRKNREKMPPIKSPYDDEFLEQLKPFLTSAKFINFLGGEPFLNPIYYKIFKLLMVRNKSVYGAITTNGSIYNSKIEEYLRELKNTCIIISMDSLNKKTYELIRKNGNFEIMMDNLQKFKNLGRLHGIVVCPMIQNVYELPKIMQFAIDNKINCTLNTVFEHLGGKLKGIHENAPEENVWVWNGSFDKKDKLTENLQNKDLIPEVSLFTLSKQKLEEIVVYLKQFKFKNQYFFHYKDSYEDFIKSLESHLITLNA